MHGQVLALFLVVVGASAVYALSALVWFVSLVRARVQRTAALDASASEVNELLAAARTPVGLVPSRSQRSLDTLVMQAVHGRGRSEAGSTVATNGDSARRSRIEVTSAHTRSYGAVSAQAGAAGRHDTPATPLLVSGIAGAGGHVWPSSSAMGNAASSSSSMARTRSKDGSQGPSSSLLPPVAPHSRRKPGRRDGDVSSGGGASASAVGSTSGSVSSGFPPMGLPNVLSVESDMTYMEVHPPRAPTATELVQAEQTAIKKQQGWWLEMFTYLWVLGCVAVQVILLVNLVRTGALHTVTNDTAQGFFTIERIFLLAAWLLNFLVVVAEDCRRIPRGAATIAWWVLAWAIELWFLVAHGWRGFSAIQPSTNKLVLPLCRTCDILLPVNFGCNSVLLVLAVVYAWRHYNASDADVYMDALARIDLPHDTRFRRVARLLGRDRVLVGTAIGAALVESGANLAFNVLWGSMVDEIESGDKASLNSVSEALGVAACGIGLAVFAGNWCSIVAGARLVLRVQNMAFGGLVDRQSQTFVDTRGADRLADVLNGEVPELKSGLTVSVTQAIEGCVTCVVVISYLFSTNWRLTLIALAGAALPFLASTGGGRVVQARQQTAEAVLEEQELLAEHFIRHSATVKQFGHEDAVKAEYSRATVRSYGLSKAAATAASALNGFNAAVMYGLFVFVFWVGGNMSIEGDIHVGFLVSIALLAFQLIDGVGRVADSIPKVWKCVEAGRGVLTMFHERKSEHGITTSDRALRKSRRGIVGHIKLERVSFAYPVAPHKEVLRDVTVRALAGEQVAVVGLPGSGKTALLNMIQALYRPTFGVVMVDGHDVTTLEEKWYRSQVATAETIPMLLHGTIASNIRLGANDSDVPPEAVREAARLVLADSWIDNLPNGYDTVVNTEFRPTHVPGERAWVGVDLSLAQRQQIGLARLVLRRPRIALLDECTSHLPPDTAAAVYANITAFLQSSTVVVATNNLDFATKCDRVVVLRKGVVVERGAPQVLKSRQGPFARLVGGIPVLVSRRDDNETKVEGVEAAADDSSEDNVAEPSADVSILASRLAQACVGQQHLVPGSEASSVNELDAMLQSMSSEARENVKEAAQYLLEQLQRVEEEM